MILLAIYVLLHTGCRPNEAAYIVFNKSIQENDIDERTIKANFKATVDQFEAKTNHEYYWLLPKEVNFVAKLIRNNPSTGFETKNQLTDSLRSFWAKQVLEKAKIETVSPDSEPYSLRTIRAYRSTEWVKLAKEY